ncbi:response regulator [Flavobacterium silvaticum]|uniref:Response regulator n=1 Tax=Flavobacterium silvaticum TaxID=1852020 RepID=A0A972JFN7_9FLAO|nr:response regulator [Flavobacterium silvaticum]NMH27371.1 response regulator [Flavobacterium silvaticum]
MDYTRQCLFIDDDADDQDFFCEAVKFIDPAMECFFADDGIQAINKLEDNENFIPDFIFINMNMPRMSGPECLARIAKMEHLAKSRIYMYSSSSNDQLLNEVRTLGAQDLLVKPSSISEMRALLERILS